MWFDLNCAINLHPYLTHIYLYPLSSPQIVGSKTKAPYPLTEDLNPNVPIEVSKWWVSTHTYKNHVALAPSHISTPSRVICLGCSGPWSLAPRTQTSRVRTSTHAAQVCEVVGVGQGWRGCVRVMGLCCELGWRGLLGWRYWGEPKLCVHAPADKSFVYLDMHHL